MGKTEISFELAERLDAEIVSLDSMQIYRWMDIGTAKSTPDERRRVPHHLIDLRDPSDEVTVAEFRDLARDAIADIAGRNLLPLLVGGSGLYFRAVVDDLRFPSRSPELRAELEAEAESAGAEVLHARLAELDPIAATRMEPGNARRIVRALEAIELTGRPFSENDAWDRYESIYDLRVAGLERERAELYQRIADRVKDMLEAGLIDETKRIEAAGMSRTARQALGYRQILENPDASHAELTDQIVRATKRFARRQESWFRGDPRVNWFPAEGPREGLIDYLGAGIDVV